MGRDVSGAMALAHPGKPDIKCNIERRLYDAIAHLAERHGSRVGVMARSLWSCGATVIFASHLHDRLPSHIAVIAQNVPMVEGTPRGDVELKFAVLANELDAVKAIAQQQGKKTAQLHRNALAIGIWVYEQIGVVWDMADG